MMQSRYWSVALLALGFSLPLVAAEFRGLEREMSAEERARTGVDRLTAEQRSALDAWLKQRFAAEAAAAAAPAASGQAPVTSSTAATASPAAPQPMAVKEALNDPSQMGFTHYTGERREFTARITGSFRGWTGRTLFRLDNGQVWQQSESASYAIELDNPEVRLRPKAMGSWMLVLKHNNRGVRVRRVE